ncbi:MAG: cytochrome C biogenesis protein [Bacteroidetes bacterium]|nr:MAG: cytochrome C biogenesis protein [Bacteroidota bacterium]TAG93554.1 MAG: cytochrome C biogenesis protein [Bacteroidota bacterium]
MNITFSNIFTLIYTLGDAGHLSVIIAFVSAFVSALSYGIAQHLENKQQNLNTNHWYKLGKNAFFLHALAVLSIVIILFDIIYNHRYQYHYAWDHSSNFLQVQYMVACFWEGQEGSFLLWLFWHVCLGFIILRNKFWEKSVMTIFMSVQFFLASMILGVMIFGIKIGSDPFILLKDAMPDLPIYKTNPNFVPEDGSGLNALLQNYWMVIHPPTLFLGFATSLVPFAFCMAGLWLNKTSEWIKPALKWSLFSAGILGLGIMMGAYWAYETLNFGGYWNWDPVENAVYIPWLVMVGAIHTLNMYQREKTSLALKISIILVVSAFILILYSTFLTRSGILGNASVHSFTDLGLSGQLLLYLLFFLFGSIILMILKWKKIEGKKKEVELYGADFWIFLGAMTLVLASIQVLMTTSIPVFNKILEVFYIKSNVALPADQIAHYTKFQLWAGFFVALFAGTGQFFWWKRINKENILNIFAIPLIVTFLSSAVLMIAAGVQNFAFIMLLTACIYAFVSNSMILIMMLRKKQIHLSGGAIAHLGVALMLLGILFSAGYSNIISKNVTGKIYNKDWKNEDNADNVLLWLNQPAPMSSRFQITYKGDYVEAKNFPHFIKKTSLIAINNQERMVLAKEDISFEGKTYFKKGDKVEIFPENTYYKVDYRDKNTGKIFSLYPRGQVNPQMGGLLASPDIFKEWTQDLYTHVSSIPDPTKERGWSPDEERTAKIGDTLILNDYFVVFDSKKPVAPQELKQELRLLGQESGEFMGVQATLRVLNKENKTIYLKPVFFVKDQSEAGNLPDFTPEFGIKIALKKITPNPPDEKGRDLTDYHFTINTTQKDYIIMKAVEKPLINLLWIGTIIVIFGFMMGIFKKNKTSKIALEK